ncbi:MAG: hypothetical protein IKZ56_07330, partial [Bacteroidales bacterium]|nr:hypothetical protein [Bacteroidales bacterium]
MKNYIRPVRDFGDEAEAFWMDPYLADGTKSGSLEVSPQTTATYDAVVVFGQDTLPLTGTVVVHEKYDTDTLYEVVCQSTEPYNSKKSSLFTNLDISQVTHGYDTLSRTTHTIHGCDSTVALLLKVVGDCEHFYRDSICPIVTQHDFLPFDTTFLPGTISGVYEHHGKKTVEGTEIDTVAFYDLTIMPEYHLTDDLHLCLEEETTVIPYTENEHVTITVTHGKITLASDDARVVIDSTDKVNGNFVLRMTTEFGCDSLVTLHIDTSSVQFDTVRRTDVFVANTPECTDRVIGAQNSTSSYYPLSNYNNYSCSQQIFTPAELGEAGPINTISFNYASATPTTSKTDVKIYLAHTTKNSFSGSYDWVSPSSMTLVYDGELNCANQGWNEFVLNQTFDYNGTDNLLVMVLDESDAGDGSYSFYSTSTPGGNYKTLYYYSSGSYWVIGSYGYRGSYRSDIRFSGCTEDNVFYTTEVAGNSFTVSEPGTYTKTETVTGSNGCDSTTTTILVVRPPYEDEICDSTFHAETQTWTDNVEPYCWQHLGASYCIAGKTLDKHGLYEFFGKDTIGGVEMDTTLYLKLTINPTYRDTNDVQLCVDGRDTTFTHPDNNDVRIAISGTGEVTSVTSVNTEKVTVEPLLVDGVPSATDFVLRMKTVKGCDSVEVLHIETTIVKRDTIFKEVLLVPDAFTTTTVCIDTFIGTQSSYGSYFPLYNYYNYSCTQQIFTRDEMGNAGTIEKISFNYADATSTNLLNDVYIYLGHTDKSSFASGSDWTSPSNLSLVYHGPMNCHSGWNEITLDTLFDYNGTDNLIVMLKDDSGGGWENNYRFYYSTTTSNRSLYYYSDSNKWDISTFTYSTYGISTNRSDIRFYGCHEEKGVEFDDKLFVVDEQGTYIIRDTVAGSNGCDSITTRILIVEEPHEDEICDSTFNEDHIWVDNVGSYCWEYNSKNNCIADKDVNADGYYEFPDTKTIDGHEFEITSYLKLTINPTSRDTDTVTTCLYEEPTEITYSVNGGTLSLSLTEAKVTVTN